MEKAWTPGQETAINSVDCNMQIVACAGSGKTTTMVAHILKLLEQDGVSPENIVAITYTEKAAASLKHKVYDEYEKKNHNLEGLANMFIGTIHGFCLNMLQSATDDYKSFETLNEVQSRLFIKNTRYHNGIMDVNYHPANGKSPYKLVNDKTRAERWPEAISAYKSFLDIGREYGVENLPTNLQRHIQKYENTLIANSFFDFTSIITTTLRKLQEGYFDDNVVSTVKYLIIDEYQDVNIAQEQIIKYFADRDTYICVVGDDDQTIYQWRGSNLSFIKNFSNRYPDVKKVDLDINFRSSQGITEIAKQVINNNINRIEKNMQSNNSQAYESGDIITYEFEDKESEIDFIVNKIKQLIGTAYTRKGHTFGLDYDDMVILVSSVKKIPELISALEENNIDFIVEGTKNLFDSNEIKVLCDTLGLLFDSIDPKSKSDTISRLSEKDIPDELVLRWSQYSDLSLSEIESSIKDFIMHPYKVDEYEFTIQGSIKKLFRDLKLFTIDDDKILYNWGKFTEMVNDFEKINLKIAPPYRLLAFRSFLTFDAPNLYPEGWLSPNFKAIKCLRIMTYHQSKGLEYPVVFMPFLTKHSIFPQKNPGGTNAWGIFNDNSIKQQYADDDESIRRVFYVGMTRSEKYLFLTRSDNVSPGGGRTYKTAALPFVEAKHSPYKETKLFLDKEYERSEERKFSTDEIITLNFSLLKDLFDCPYKFKLTNVFGFCSPLNIRMGYGRSIHNMLDFIHRNYQRIDYNNPKVIEGIVKKYLHLPYGSPKLYEAMTEKATINLTSYIKNNSSKFKYIKFSEKSIDFSIDEYMFINGRIDLVRDELNNTITLVDFKSSSEVLSKDQIKNQLMVYVLGYENLTGEKVDYIESYDFNNSNPITIELLDDDRDKFVKKLEECEDNIKNSNYPKATELRVPKAKTFCKELKCDYYQDCHPTER